MTTILFLATAEVVILATSDTTDGPPLTSEEM